MEFSGSRIINADRQTVWQALNSADVLRQSVPGCTELNGDPDSGYEAEIVQKVGPLKVKMRGKISLENIVANESYTIVGEGQGGAAGFAKGGADVRLSDAEEGTELSYTATVKIGGKLAQLGSRLIDGFARKATDQFFTAFKEAVETAEN